MIKQVIKIFVVLTSFILLAVIAVGQFNTASAAYAIYVAEKSFDTTRVEDDLADMDLQYVKENYSDVSIIELAEYCYSDNVFKQGNYGLYLYVYNPERITFSIAAGANVVNMAVGYNDKGEPNAYENMSLTYLGKTTGDNDGLFYKFKVTDAAELLPVVKEYSKTYGERRYDIAGIQLRTMGEALAEDYTVGGTWHYTGFAKGYGKDDTAESTLECEQTDLITLSLDVMHTYYRSEYPNEQTDVGADSENIYDQLSSVYFSVPNDVIDTFGDISAVHAEWYEYRTKPIFITGNSEVYNGLKSYIGYDIGLQTSDRFKPYSYSSEVKYGFASDYTYSEFGYMTPAVYDYGYNLNTDWAFCGGDGLGGARDDVLTTLYWLFPSGTDSAGDYVLSREAIQEYVSDYSNGKSDLINDKYSMSLFTEDVGNSRIAGYNNWNISSDYEYTLENVPVQNFFEDLFGIYDDSEFNNVQAIQRITANDISSNNAETVSKALYISENDYDDFKAYYDNASNQSETVFLFRFALTDYYSAQCHEFDGSSDDQAVLGEYIDSNAYLAYMNVFLDFDIIDITFCRDGVYTVIPAVADPIDIFSDVTPPPDFEKYGLAWWQILLIVIGVIVVIYLIYKFIGWVCGKNKTVTVRYKRNKRKRKRR